MANVKLVAKRAGVSTATVSRVLNNHPTVSDEVRQRVVIAANEAGYVQSVGRRASTNIALLYTGEPTLGSPFDAAVMAGLSRALEHFGYDLIILQARRSKLPHETYTQMFVRKGIRGVVIRTTANTHDVCEQIAAENFPSVVVSERFDNPRINYVYSDSREPSREAVEHLIGLGHRKIAISVNIVEDSDHADRLAGYQQALADHGIEMDRKLVLRVPANRQAGAQLMRRVMTMPEKPTAIFMTDPLTVVAAIAEARKMNVDIPRDLSIVGFDDSDLRFSLHPELTAVCQDASALGREAFTALHGIMDQPENAVPVRKSLRAWLEAHGSTAAPKAV